MWPPSESLGIYVSVPFCRAKCSFCNFASGVGSAEAVERYVDLLCAEIRGVRRQAERSALSLPHRVDSVYLGGGTPSLLAPRQLEAIFAALRAEFELDAAAEITLEAAPGQIGGATLEAGQRAGVNRVSLGVQSFVDREAQAVGRSHTAASCLAEFRRLRAAGITNLGADLIAGLPLQTGASWAETLDMALGAGLDHLSVYMLEVDEDSRLGREVLGGGARLHAPAVPSDEASAAMYEAACDRLPAAGFAQYEISNFARVGAGSRHNLKYWQRQPYLGFGLDAHSMALCPQGGGRRWANQEELADYDGTSAVAEGEAITPRQAFEETVFLGLRLCAGLPATALEPFPDAWRQEFVLAAGHLAADGLLDCIPGGWRLSRHGQLVSSAVFGELLAATPAVA